MKNVISFIVLTLLFAVAAGCSSNTDVYDPDKTKDCGRQDAEVLSAAQIRSATDRAIREILSSSPFQPYIQSNKVAGKVPLMTTAPLRNDTNDPYLDGETVNIRIADALFNAGLVRVSDRNAVRGAATGRSCNLTGAPSATDGKSLIEAPQLMMSCRISLQEDRLGSKKEISAVLSVQITELKSGENVMRTSVVWSAEERRSFLGL